MTTRVPDWWQFILLALASYRLYRLAARDTITEPLRAAASYPDAEAITLDAEPHIELPPARDPGKPSGGGVFPKTWRIYLATLIRCPWCLGAYLSVGIYSAWLWEPHLVLGLSVPAAISALIGMVAKLDK